MIMKLNAHTSLFLYGAAALFILGWWFAAFHYHEEPIPQNTISVADDPKPSLYHQLCPIDREQLKCALDGDKALMTKLINDWDVDAQILEGFGLTNIQRLTRETYLRAHVLGRQLLYHPKDHLESLRYHHRAKVIVDDSGNIHHLHKAYHRFLPQTYTSATFLLALTKPDEIVALPEGIRSLSPYSHAVPLDIDRYHSEKIFLANPDLAFTADYSNPATVEALRNQGIRLVTINSGNSVLEIIRSINTVGQFSNRSLEAEMMSIFIEAAMIALDNHLAAIKQNLSEKSSVLYLNYHVQYSIPSGKTLTGQLLERIGLQDPTLGKLLEDHPNEWIIPIDQEKILKLNPEYIIVGSDNTNNIKQQIVSNPAFATVSAVKNAKVFTIDDSIQHSPTQYIVLGYYDLIQAISP